jgi:hypothetical protein
MSVDGWSSSNQQRSQSRSPAHGKQSEPMSLVSSQHNDSVNPSIQSSPSSTGASTLQSATPVTRSDDREDFTASLFPLRDKDWLAKKVILPSRLSDFHINAKVGEGTFGYVFLL